VEFPPEYDSDKIFKTLLDDIPWIQNVIELYGIKVKEPRLTSWHSDYSYTYSRNRRDPQPWTPMLLDLKTLAETVAASSFNGVLLNLYRTGEDSIGFHADNEKEFGHNPTIVSMSFGGMRLFELQNIYDSSQRVILKLESGSILIMSGETQTYWKHGVRKTKKPVEPRINLTFRNIIHPK
jgi:alkylated DNA repair dioxygenase AlkB